MDGKEAINTDALNSQTRAMSRTGETNHEMQ